MIYVGRFNEEQLAADDDRAAVQKAMNDTGMQYVHTELVKKNGQYVAMKIWVCSREEYLASNEL